MMEDEIYERVTRELLLQEYLENEQKRLRKPERKKNELA